MTRRAASPRPKRFLFENGTSFMAVILRPLRREGMTKTDDELSALLHAKGPGDPDRGESRDSSLIRVIVSQRDGARTFLSPFILPRCCVRTHRRPFLDGRTGPFPVLQDQTGLAAKDYMVSNLNIDKFQNVGSSLTGSKHERGFGSLPGIRRSLEPSTRHGGSDGMLHEFFAYMEVLTNGPFRKAQSIAHGLEQNWRSTIPVVLK